MLRVLPRVLLFTDTATSGIYARAQPDAPRIGLNVHVNLIPYNPIEDAPQLAGSDRPTRKEFAQTLKTAGLKTTVRHSLGNDIAAACGQLVRQENRVIARQMAVGDT